VVHPHEPMTLYLGNEQGLFRTTDGADTWQQVESPLNGLQVWSLLLLPEDPQTILAGTCPSRLFRSADAGRTWSEPAVGIRQDCPRIRWTRVTTLAAHACDPHTVWAGVEIDGLFVSRDRGVSWRAIGTGLSSRDIHGMAIVPDHGRPKRLIASTNNDLNLSTD